MRRLVIALVAVLVVAQQDYWAWDRIDPMILGVLPIGLAWHVGISLAAAMLWALATRYCWPSDVDVAEDAGIGTRGGESHG